MSSTTTRLCPFANGRSVEVPVEDQLSQEWTELFLSALRIPNERDMQSTGLFRSITINYSLLASISRNTRSILAFSLLFDIDAIRN